MYLEENICLQNKCQSLDKHGNNFGAWRRIWGKYGRNFSRFDNNSCCKGIKSNTFAEKLTRPKAHYLKSLWAHHLFIVLFIGHSPNRLLTLLVVTLLMDYITVTQSLWLYITQQFWFSFCGCITFIQSIRNALRIGFDMYKTLASKRHRPLQ